MMMATVASPIAIADGLKVCRWVASAWTCESELAGILLFVAWNMGEWRAFPQLRQFTINYRVVMVATFLLTVIFDLTVAVEVGLVLASLFFIVRIASVTRIEAIDLPRAAAGEPTIEGWRLFGSLFFGSVNRIEPLLDPGRAGADVMVLDLHQLINLDTTGLDALQSLHRSLIKRGERLVLVGANTQPLSLMQRAGFASALGEEALFDDLDSALAAIRQKSGDTAESPR